MSLKLRVLFAGTIISIIIAITCFSAPKTIEAEGIKLNHLAVLEQFIESQMKFYQIPGLAVGVVQGDKVIYLKGYGYADKSKRPVTPQTSFVIGSLSKSLTAMAIIQLADEGKIELDAPVSKYLPWLQVKNPKASVSITVRQLLNHTSGFSPAAGFSRNYFFGHDTMERFIRMQCRAKFYTPGNYHYSETNYIVLGEIIQKVSGQPYAEYIREHIFKPLDMRHSFADQDEAKRNGMAEGYQSFYGRLYPSHPPYPKQSVPAEYLISSAEDLCHYMIAQLNHGSYRHSQLVSPSGLALMHHPSSEVFPIGPNYDHLYYGLGWLVTPVDSVQQSGLVPGFSAKMFMLPQNRLGVVMLYNTSESFITRNDFNWAPIDNIPAGIITALQGYSPDECTSPNKVTYYTYFALGALAIFALIIFSFIRRKQWQQKLVNIHETRFAKLSFVFAMNFLVPMGIYIIALLPYMDSWSVFLLFSPDIGLTLLAIAFALLYVGVFKVILVCQVLDKLKEKEEEFID